VRKQEGFVDLDDLQLARSPFTFSALDELLIAIPPHLTAASHRAPVTLPIAYALAITDRATVLCRARSHC
jgi:hypothetical protein